MKPARSHSRALNEQANLSGRNKQESASNGPAVQRSQAQLTNQQASAQSIRKRRSSINVYDQPSSLNSRLRQLETDMLRLDEDRTKLYDDTHSALTQYELRLNEIQAILKSRQDNVEKYVDDMKTLLQAKEKFEKQAKLLNEKHDRIHEKFTHREITISREIKLLKNKFELLEKNRQFRSILHKSNMGSSSDNKDDLASGLDSIEFQKTNSEGTGSEVGSLAPEKLKTTTAAKTQSIAKTATKSVRIKLSKFDSFNRMLSSLFTGRLGLFGARNKRRGKRVSSVSPAGTSVTPAATAISSTPSTHGSTASPKSTGTPAPAETPVITDTPGTTGTEVKSLSGPP